MTLVLTVFRGLQVQKTEDPMLVVADIAKKKAVLERVCQPIATRPAPKIQPQPAPATAPEPAAAPAEAVPAEGGEPMDADEATEERMEL